MGRSQLDGASRQRALQSMASRTYDVLVIGGGVTGAGAALDAVTRGLSVALVEKRDWAAGTSSRSGKLFHGGVRYLEKLDFPLVREALTERDLMVTRLCPHLVRPIRFVYPIRHHWERPYMGAGLTLYDTLGGARAMPRHRQLSRRTVAGLSPAMRPMLGGISFYDAQVDDARHTLELVRTAASHGTDVASGVEVVELLTNGGRVVGARVKDVEREAEFDIRARAVVNATGVWTDRIRAMAPGRASFEVTASKGVHLMIPREKIDSDVSMFIRAEDSVLFVREWLNHWLVGTTDTAYDQQLDHPAATSTDVDYLLRNLNSILTVPLTVDDVDGVFAGLRPLVGGAQGAMSALSREHAVETSPPGLTSIAGGKYTTYRVMARDVIDAATAGFMERQRPEPAAGGSSRRARCGSAPLMSVTEGVLLLGARGLQSAKVKFPRRAAELGLTGAQTDHLLRRYGSMVDDLGELIAQRPDLGRPLTGAETYLRAEIVYAATHEGALHIDDAMTRRTRISIETRDRGLAAADEVADLLADELGWDAAQRAAEVRHYRHRVAAEIAASQVPDDAQASGLRAAVHDPRLG